MKEKEERAEGTGPHRRTTSSRLQRKRVVDGSKRRGRVGVLIETRTKASGRKAKTAGEMKK